jgi:hypothetical protein
MSAHTREEFTVRANVKVITDIMDPAVCTSATTPSVAPPRVPPRAPSSWAAFTGPGAFVLGGIYREWTPLLSREESKLRLGLLLTQISKAEEHGSRVVVHRDFNVDLDREEDKEYRPWHRAAACLACLGCTLTT